MRRGAGRRPVRRWSLITALSALAGILAALAAVAPASAAAAAAEQSCPIKRYGYTGYRICVPDTEYLTDPWWSDQVKETFVIGSDHAVWHSWPGSAGWYSMGGYALAVSGDLDAWYNSKAHHVVGVYAPDYHWWCSVLLNGAWTSWAREDRVDSCYSM